MVTHPTPFEVEEPVGSCFADFVGCQLLELGGRIPMFDGMTRSRPVYEESVELCLTLLDLSSFLVVPRLNVDETSKALKLSLLFEGLFGYTRRLN